jgi:hypothetical protein
MGASAAAVVLRARAAIIRGHDRRRSSGSRRWPRPIRPATPRSSSGCCTSRSAAADGLRLLQPVLQHGADADDVFALVRAGRAARALGRVEDANDLFRTAAAIAGDDADLQVAWGELLLEKHNVADACAPSASRCRATAATCPRCSDSRGHGRDRPGARAQRPRPRALDQRARPRRARVRGRARARRPRRRRGDGRHRSRPRGQPAPPRGAAIQAAIAWLHDERDLFETRVGRGARPAPGLRGCLPDRRQSRRAALPLRRGGRAGRAGRRPRSRARTRARRARHAPAAHRRRGPRAPGARRRVQARPVRRGHLQPAGAARHPRSLRHDRAGAHPHEARSGRGAGAQGARRAARGRGARGAQPSGTGSRPTGPILIEIFPRHDDFAVRTSVCPA